MVWVPLSLSPVNSMSLLELHIIKFLVPHRNLQLRPMLLFNFSVTNKTDCKSQTFHGETCFPVFIFWFLLMFSAEYEHPTWIRHSCINHPTEKQTIKKPKTKQTKKKWDFMSQILFESYPALLFSWLFPISLSSFSELLKSSTLCVMVCIICSKLNCYVVWLVPFSFLSLDKEKL